MPDAVPLSDHCSLMSREGGPPAPSVRPADCPKDAVYIKGHVATFIGNPPFPIIFESGDGDDKVTVIGSGKGGIYMSGGNGKSSLTVEDPWTALMARLSPDALATIILAIAMLVAVVAITWRALTATADRNN